MNVIWTLSMSWSCASLTSGTVCSQQNVIDAAINEWRKQLRTCMHADGQHFEHLLRARVINKSYGQIKCKQLCLFSKRRSFTAELVIFGVLKFPKVRYVQWTGKVVCQTTFQWHIYSAIFVLKITGIRQVLLKLSLVVGWYPTCCSSLNSL